MSVQAPEFLTRSYECSVRAIDEEKREAEFVAATENPVRVWGGREVLRMSGARLQRFRSNPVALDAHDRFSSESVIGSATVKREGRQLTVRIRYATTPRAENVWTLVREGHLKAVSIGYAPNPQRVRFVAEGEFDGEGDARVEGPAYIVREWELLEVSNVPVPADKDALRRAFYEPLSERREPMSSVYEAAAQGGAQNQPAPPATPAPTQGTATRAPAEQPRFTVLTDGERSARDEQARAEGIRNLAQLCGLADQAPSLILRGLSIEAARAELLRAHTERHQPVGTPEPTQEPAAQSAEADTETEEQRAAEIDTAVRSLFTVGR